jgi:proteasome lid subunit RPN8/RPN11
VTWKIAAINHAMEELPREACGLVVQVDERIIYWPCDNLALDSDHFIMCPYDYAAADMTGDLLGVFHSHPYIAPEPSEVDRMACDASGLPWHIVSVPSCEWHYMEPQSGIIQP